MGIIFSSFNGLEEKVPYINFSHFEWHKDSFSKLFYILSNNTFSRAELEHFGTIKNIHYGDILIKFGDTLDATNADIPYIKDNLKFKADYLQNGDLIISDTAEDYTAGKSTEIYNICDAKVISGLHTIPCRPQIKFAEKYLGYYTNSPAFRTQLLSLLQGIKVFSISKSNLNNTNICYPSLSEQQKIADFLSLVDARIEKQRLLVESLKKYKRGLLSAIFDRKLRFKDENGNDYPEWENKKISDIFKLTRGYVLATSEISELQTSEFKYPVYSSQTKNEGLLGYYNKYLYKNAITWTTDGANAGYVKFRNGEFYCTNVCGVLLCNKGNCNSYIAEKLNSVTKRHVSYVGNPKLMNNVMAEIYIDFPSIQEQKRNSKLLTKIDEKIKTSNFLYDRLILLKQGLLQQMFI